MRIVLATDGTKQSDAAIEITKTLKLEDGDEIIMKGFCEREGFKRIGFGECRGKILPAD